MERTDQTWVDELLGHLGRERMEAAYHDLGNALRKAAYKLFLNKGFDSSEASLYADDATQRTLLKLVENERAAIRSYRGSGHFTSYATQIVVNNAYAVMRSLRKQAISLDLQNEGASPGEEEARVSGKVQVAFATPAREQPEAAFLREQMLQEVDRAMQQCIAALTDLRRTIFEAAEQEGRGRQEIANTYQITLVAFDNNLNRAKKSLRECLQRKGITSAVLAELAK